MNIVMVIIGFFCMLIGIVFFNRKILIAIFDYMAKKTFVTKFWYDDLKNIFIAWAKFVAFWFISISPYIILMSIFGIGISDKSFVRIGFHIYLLLVSAISSYILIKNKAKEIFYIFIYWLLLVSIIAIFPSKIFIFGSLLFLGTIAWLIWVILKLVKYFRNIDTNKTRDIN